jgi:hypothetical protein
MFWNLTAVAVLSFAPVFAQAPATSQAPAALPEARQLIERHIKAVGGRAAILSHKSVRMTATVSVPASGITGPMEVWGATNPSRVLVKYTVPGIGEIAEGFDGTHGWTTSPMTGPMLKRGKELEQTKLDADLYSELRDPKHYPTVKTVEKTTFDGRPCYKVALTRIDGAQDFDFYDVATGLRAGGIVTRESAMGTMTVTTVDGGYKKFGNLLHSTVHTQKVMGVEQTVKIDMVEYDKVDPSVFTLPPAIKALIK